LLSCKVFFDLVGIRLKETYLQGFGNLAGIPEIFNTNEFVLIRAIRVQKYKI
jgi:hypothetical protein